MRHDKLGLQLELLLMLTENRQWTVEQMCEHLGIGKRNLYYYLEFFKGAEFNLVKHGRLLQHLAAVEVPLAPLRHREVHRG